MSKFLEKHGGITVVILAIVILGLGGMLVYGYRVQTQLEAQNASLRHELGATQAVLAQKESDLAQYGTNLDELRQAYALSEENGSELLKELTEEKNRNEEFEEQIQDISGTVGKLDKLSKLDSELLMKYSKVYFLNEHYAPEKTYEIPEMFRFKKDEPEYISAQVWPYLEDMLEDAQEDDVNLYVVSGFRSYDEQRGLKSTYTVQYGSGANTFSADQGYSEHQLGTTVDFTTDGIGGGLTGFEKTEAYEWLTRYAHKYGFVLSYPKDNAYYVFEPWHWRFVGEDLADDLHDDEKYFYDLDQREIDSYLISIFD